ncbi:interleukin-17D isoform X2 [Alligator mississippiensis]|uniref:Interleukin-17D n=1 Tax=Alligator mississippiensis TaxID=8496 RepID=A0A151P6A6_ALLMI|nr:interleukin-17D isoform X2 [Alligator mississippiensis]KYO44607.1 interleukin-17D [Alligator mississippiensis]
MQLQVKVTAQVLLCLVFRHTFSAHIPCQEPSDAELESILNPYLASGASLLAQTDEVLPDEELKACPVNVNQTSSRLQDKSTSPWSYRVSEDPNRYPQKIVEAYCLCKGCLVNGQEDKAVNSEPFYLEVPVLQKSNQCKRGQYVYQPNHLQVAQFCFCSFP